MATEHTGDYGGLAQVEDDTAPDSADTSVGDGVSRLRPPSP